MALNWDAFLNTDGFNASNDRWSDLLPQPTTAPPPPSSQMPKSTSTDTSDSSPEGVINFDSLLTGASGDPYFDDSLFLSNDYLLGDFDVLKPFGSTIGGGASTSESSPEPTSGPASQAPSQKAAYSDTGLQQSPHMSSVQKQAFQRATAFPNPTYESMFPNNQEAGFVEDLTFPNGPQGRSTTSKPGLEKNPGSIASTTTNKRNKNKPDSLSACWTSPLCPNHDQNGPAPNPSTCGGGCAPFLFADQDAFPSLSSLLTEPQEVTAEDGIVEIQPRPKKRSESDASVNGFSGRQFESNGSSPNDDRPRTKSETTEMDILAKDTVQANDDDKPKSRRRLPHNQVERKYRESLNTQLESLKRVVPSLQQGSRVCDGADIEDLPTPSKPSKAVILASATTYIKQMEKDKKSLADENQLLRTRVKALQALVKCDDCSLMQYVMDLKIKQGN